MTELYLQKDGGMMTRVYFDGSGTGFKLTRENPYFTQAESYTLDVILPMDIIENRSFFQNLQRMERTKQPETDPGRRPERCLPAKFHDIIEKYQTG